MSDVTVTLILNDVKISLLNVISVSSKRIIQNSLIFPCKAGCSACCKRYIRISVIEAMFIIEHLKNTGNLSNVMKKAEEQSKMSMECDPMAWYKMQIPCPVLENNECLAYNVRPISCSTHFVTSNPKACDPFSTDNLICESYDMHDLYMKFVGILENKFKKHSIFQYQLPISVALKLANKFMENSYTNLKEIISLYNMEMSML